MFTLCNIQQCSITYCWRQDEDFCGVIILGLYYWCVCRYWWVCCRPLTVQRRGILLQHAGLAHLSRCVWHHSLHLCDHSTITADIAVLVLCTSVIVWESGSRSGVLRIRRTYMIYQALQVLIQGASVTCDSHLGGLKLQRDRCSLSGCCSFTHFGLLFQVI